MINMKKWLYIRLGIVAASAAFSALAGPVTAHSDPPVGLRQLVFGFLFGIAGMLVLLALQFLNKRSPESWQRPTWHEKPFQFKQPLQFLHLGAWILIMSSLVTASMTWHNYPEFTLDALMPLVIGIGMMLGVYLAPVVFRSKYKSG